MVGGRGCALLQGMFSLANQGVPSRAKVWNDLIAGLPDRAMGSGEGCLRLAAFLWPLDGKRFE
jgi:hypothetical protein